MEFGFNHAIANILLITVMSTVVNSINSYNKCSAVAEIGDRLATIDMDGKLAGCAV